MKELKKNEIAKIYIEKELKRIIIKDLIEYDFKHMTIALDSRIGINTAYGLDKEARIMDEDLKKYTSPFTCFKVDYGGLTISINKEHWKLIIKH